MTFKQVEETTLKYVKICDDPLAKTDGRYKDAKLEFIKCLRVYIDERIRKQLRSNGIELFDENSK